VGRARSRRDRVIEMNPKYKKYLPLIDIDTLLALNECGKHKVS